MPGAEALEVVEPGLLASIQDGGRTGLAAEGVTRGGAADTWSLAVANLLLGNAQDAAAIEVTLSGAAFRALRPVTVAISGTIAARLERSNEQVLPGTARTLAAGEVLRIDGPATGARAYLAVAGGIDVPVVLGSRATALGAGFGGLDGRALRAGDRLRCVDTDVLRPDARWSGATARAEGPIRVLEGSSSPPFVDAVDILVATPWTVLPASDRMGLRLDGPPLPIDDGEAWVDISSSGVVAGTVQVPRDRRPIVLLADHQPTGGYPVVAVVISADLPRLGQLAPGATVDFERVTSADARKALVEQREALRAAAATLGEDAAWDDLWRWAR